MRANIALTSQVAVNRLKKFTDDEGFSFKAKRGTFKHKAIHNIKGYL